MCERLKNEIMLSPRNVLPEGMTEDEVVQMIRMHFPPAPEAQPVTGLVEAQSPKTHQI